MATTIKLTGRLADITSAPISQLTECRVKAPAYAPGPAVEITTSAPQKVDVGADGALTINVVEGIGWLYLTGPGWTESIRFVAAAGMSTIWEAVVNAMPIIVEAKRLLWELGKAYEDSRADFIALGTKYAKDFAALKAETDALVAQLNEAYASSKAGQAMPPYLTQTALDARFVKRGELMVSANEYGVKGDGTTNDTARLQAALDASAGKTLFVPPGTYMVDAIKGLNVPSNTSVVFAAGAVLKAIPNNAGSYSVLKLWDVKNVTITGATIQGDRAAHTGTTGEWGMGIDIRGATNINIWGGRMFDCWGDGIYIGETANQTYCKAVTIRDVECDNNRRQGISVISARDLLIDSCRMLRTNGIAPEAGIDIEPNNVGNDLENIRITNLYTEGNKSCGLLFALILMRDSGKTVDITVDGLECVDNAAVQFNKEEGKLDGTISIRNVMARRGGVLVWNTSINFPKITFRDVTLIDPNPKGLTSAKYGSAFTVYADQGDTNTDPIGGVTVENLTVMDTRVTKLVKDAVHIRNYSTSNVTIPQKVHLINPIRLDNTNSQVNFTAIGQFADGNSVSEKDLAGIDYPVASYAWVKLFHNASSTARRTVTFANTINDDAPSIEVEVRAPYPIRIVPTGMVINTMTTVAGKYIESSEVGARIELQKRGGKLWVKKIIGKWTAEA